MRTHPCRPPLVAAGKLRDEAARECDAKRWRECLFDLDRARDLDPHGDDDPAVQTQRKRAIDALQDKPPKPPVR